MRAVIVTGDRYASPDDWGAVVEDALLQAKQGVSALIVIHGAASGIDSIAHETAGRWRGIHAIPVPAQWTALGRPAGPRRNTAMLSMLRTLADHGYAIRVLAFHDDPGLGIGTKDMVKQARAAGVEVRVYRSNGETEVPA